jgi:hypothetical protein
MGVDHSFQALEKFQECILEATLHPSITLLEKLKHYTYSLIIGRRLCLLIGISTLNE